MSKFTEHTTISGRKIKTRSNNSKRHWTIVTEAGHYRTFPQNKIDFNSMYYWTGNDWQNFLKTDEYFKV